jgi:hypothetical protein
MPRAVTKATSNDSPDFAHTTKILSDLRDFWIKQSAETKLDPLHFSRLGVVALTQWSAVVGVDIGMSAENFSSVCNAQFKAAYDRAPKFG